MESAFAWAMAGAASAHQAATASCEQNSQQRAGRTRRTTADPQRAQQGATAAAAAAPAALDSLSRLQQLADASPQVAQLRRLQALADARFAPVAQLAGGPEEGELLVSKFATAELQLQPTPRANNTGLPDQLKSGIESLSGLSMDHVRVHFNSSQPAQLNALAYAQGSDIHLAPGQEQHLPHEAWHVVQQAQGRVRETVQMAGVGVNDDAALEREADAMGAQAARQPANEGGATPLQRVSAGTNAPVQRSGKGIAGGMALGAGIGALGFFAGPLVGGITTAIGAVIGGIVGHLKTQSPLPSGAYARKDKTLSPVTTGELDDILMHATRTPDQAKVLIKQTGDVLIAQGLLFWTDEGSEHCEVIVDNHKEYTYRVRVIVVIPHRPTRTAQDVDMQRGAAVHELIHAIEVVSRIGGVQNLGVDIPKVVDNDSGKVLKGRELQWSKVPAVETNVMIDTLMRQMNELVVSEEKSKKVHRNQLTFLWSHYLQRLAYAKDNRHEVPTVVLQLFEDIHALDEEDQLKDTEFYHTLLAARQRLMDLL